MSTCPNPLCRRGFRAGHVRDTKTLVSQGGEDDTPSSDYLWPPRYFCPCGHFEVSAIRSVRAKCPNHNQLIYSVMQRLRTHGHFEMQNSFLAGAGACMRVRTRVHIYTYLVSEVSMCPKPLFYKGSSVGHFADTRIVVSEARGKESISRPASWQGCPHLCPIPVKCANGASHITEARRSPLTRRRYSEIKGCSIFASRDQPPKEWEACKSAARHLRSMCSPVPHPSWGLTPSARITSETR